MSKHNNNLTCDTIQIDGMTCTSCEVIIERRLKQLNTIKKVNVHHASGRCDIYSRPNTTIRLSDIQAAIADDGYTARLWDESTMTESRTKQWRELGVIALIIFAVYMVLKTLGVFSFATTIDSSLSLGAVFVIGLVAATSTCIAVVGGLVISVTAKYNEIRGAETRWEKFKPHILFNIGRLASYFVLGGVIGLIGNAVTPSPRFTGVLTVLIAIVMILLGIDILKLFKTNSLIPKMPKAISHRLHTLAESDKPYAPLVLGAATFFLPCGFTQSMQLFALTTGSFWLGGTTMFVFALGTMPALLSLGALSSFSKGTFSKYFLKFSGVLVLMLGFYNFNNGLALTGVNAATLFGSSSSNSEQNVSAEISGDTQVVEMAVNGIRYEPSSITIKNGVPVEWRIDATKAAGCAQSLVVPQLGIGEFLSPNADNVVTFTPEKTGKLPFTCSMGMTSGTFVVVD